MDETLKSLLIGVVVGIVLGLIVLIPVLIFTSPVVQISLVNANSDLAGGPQAFEFKVNGKEIPPFTPVRVIRSRLEVEVIEFASQKVVDKIDIASLIRKGDLIAAEYFGRTSPQGEELYINIKHIDGKVNRVSVNIH